MERVSIYSNSMYIVAVCSDRELPPLQTSIYEGSVPQNALSSLIGGLNERDRKISELSKDIAEFCAQTPERTGAVAAKAVSYAVELLEDAKTAYAAALEDVRRQLRDEHRARVKAERTLRQLPGA